MAARGREKEFITTHNIPEAWRARRSRPWAPRSGWEPTAKIGVDVGHISRYILRWISLTGLGSLVSETKEREREEEREKDDDLEPRNKG